MRDYIPSVIRSLLEELRVKLTGSRFDRRIVGKNVIDTGPQAARAIEIARRLNAVRKGRPKQPVVLWNNNFSALTLRGRWVYIAKGLSERLTDDGLAFVLAHEMAHHDLDHLTVHMAMAGMLGWKQDMEGHADRRACEMMVAAGFDPQGALEVTHRDLWDDEPEDDLSHWPEGLRDWAQRHRRSHPLMSERHEAIKRWIVAL
jgi:Zn-dependent protease with chaperone function